MLMSSSDILIFSLFITSDKFFNPTDLSRFLSAIRKTIYGLMPMSSHRWANSKKRMTFLPKGSSDCLYLFNLGVKALKYKKRGYKKFQIRKLGPFNGRGCYFIIWLWGVEALVFWLCFYSLRWTWSLLYSFWQFI